MKSDLRRTSETSLARSRRAGRGLFCGSGDRWAGDQPEHTELVRRAKEASVDATELDIWPGVVSPLPEHGRGGVAGVAAGECSRSAYLLRRPVDVEFSMVVAVLRAAQSRCRLR